MYGVSVIRGFFSTTTCNSLLIIAVMFSSCSDRLTNRKVVTPLKVKMVLYTGTPTQLFHQIVSCHVVSTKGKSHIIISSRLEEGWYLYLK